MSLRGFVEKKGEALGWREQTLFVRGSVMSKQFLYFPPGTLSLLTAGSPPLSTNREAPRHMAPLRNLLPPAPLSMSFVSGSSSAPYSISLSLLPSLLDSSFSVISFPSPEWKNPCIRTCAVKKAGVRDPEGSAGLLSAMETRSLPARRRWEEPEISRPSGFLLLVGLLRSGVLSLCRCRPDDRFKGCALWSGLRGDEGEQGDKRSWAQNVSTEGGGGGGVHGWDECPRSVLNLMTEEQTSSWRSDLGSALTVLRGEHTAKEENRPEWR